MLQLKGIVKDYILGDTKVQALKGVDLNFRRNEFVSILGPSGCGKTTMLNIIGGLDRYTDGDLVINGTSTKKFSDSDWDTYRNNTIGFVFQNYNLIPHLNVLGNVELALTLSGVDTKERKKMAEIALEKVGLADQIHKKPNQLSGGQMQRVAIARALVNNPDVILADEPTGALDTGTSVQVMDLLKEIAKEKLIIMVTHNPDLANTYSTRIIKLLDGQKVDDTMPYSDEELLEDTKVDTQIEELTEKEKKKKAKKTSMSFITALSLSFRNLFTKKTRTLLTSFAGSIGIIGIALILSLSSGFQAYIANIERETLSAYPLVITETNTDMSSFMGSMMGSMSSDVPKFPDSDIVTINPMFQNMVNSATSATHYNDLKSFKKYIEENKSKTETFASVISYSYNIDINVYSSTYSATSNNLLNPYNIMDDLSDMSGGMSDEMGAGSMSSFLNVWNEMVSNYDLINEQYDILDGHLPENKNEVILVVDSYNQLNDYALYSLGYRSKQDLVKMVLSSVTGIPYTPPQTELSFSEILQTKYKVIPSSDYFVQNGSIYESKKENPSYMKGVLDTAEELQIVGIVRAKEGVTGGLLTANSLYYTNELAEHLITKGAESDVVKAQRANPDVNVLTGGPFEDEISYMQVQRDIGIADLDTPSSIYLYPLSFETKADLEAFIADYNEGKEKKDQIEYTDMVAMMMSSVGTIINAISYVLIAFVAISLVVSSIMIGIITYISVLERTKEIGVLRAIGARKKDIARVFNAETVIVGFIAGLIGILITLLLTLPINAIIYSLASIKGVAKLPWLGAIILIAISVLLTMVAGLIPSRVAAKKDPVEALRSE